MVDTKILADYRLSDRPRYFNGREEELMTIPDEIRDCVAFVGFNQKRTSEFVLTGTTFFVRMDVFGEQIPALYAITARHVVEDAHKNSIDGKIILKVNDCKDGTRQIATSYDHWFYHDSNEAIDVAILPLKNLDIDFGQKFFPVDRFAIGDNLTRSKIRLGEEVFLTGLFHGHSGSWRNLPIVRVGNIAAMVREPIQSKDFNDNEIRIYGYLVELRSIGGLSGSPVFAVLDEATPGSQYVSTMPVPLTDAAGYSYDGSRQIDPVSSIQRQYCLMGLLHGHYEVTSRIPYLHGGKVMRDEQINLGIGIVIPAADINDVLFNKAIESERAAMFRAHMAAKPTVKLD